jgi:hypothetical protein
MLYHQQIFVVKKSFLYTLPLSKKTIRIFSGTPIKDVSSYEMPFYDMKTDQIFQLMIYRFNVLTKEYQIELNKTQFEEYIKRVSAKDIWSDLNECPTT